MSGVTLNLAFLAGVKAGIADSVMSIQSTLNNQYLWEIALALIGFATGIGIFLYFIKGHKSEGSLASMSSNGVSDAYYASEYMKRGGDIDHAASQDFIRDWAKKNM